MKEIKFRGKHITTGVWMYGSYYNDCGEEYILPCMPGSATDYEDYQVNQNTVGQYTGLKDKNGKEIYEGDIIQLRQPDGNCVLCEVSFCEKGYWAISFGINERVILGYINRDHIEVIGNIHDNPKLIKKEG